MESPGCERNYSLTISRPAGVPSPGSSEALATLSRRTGEGLGVRGGSWAASVEHQVQDDKRAEDHGRQDAVVAEAAAVRIAA